MQLVAANKLQKGDVIPTAQLAGIMAAKQTASLIPLCHSLPLSQVRCGLPCAGLWGMPKPEHVPEPQILSISQHHPAAGASAAKQIAHLLPHVLRSTSWLQKALATRCSKLHPQESPRIWARRVLCSDLGQGWTQQTCHTHCMSQRVGHHQRTLSFQHQPTRSQGCEKNSEQ